MSQSFTSLLYHVIFSTKDRQPFIDAEIASQLHAYMAGVIHNVGGRAVLINGIDDHIHILSHFPKTRTVPDVIRDIKSNSSRWVHESFQLRKDFGWQRGYAAFSVSRSASDQVRDYIATQEEHHRTMTFQDEYRAFLRRHEIEFDERYMWD